MYLSAWRQLARKITRKNRQGKRGPSSLSKSTKLFIELLEDRTLLSTASTYLWTGAGATTNWNDSSNWVLGSATGNSNGYPSAAGDIAQFKGSPAISTVTLAIPITVGEIDFNTSASITIGGSSALTLDNTNFGATALISVQAGNTGTQTILTPLLAPHSPLAATVNAGVLQLGNNGVPSSFAAGSTFAAATGGTISILQPNNTGTAALAVNTGGTISVNDGGNGTLGNINCNGGTFIYTGTLNTATTENAGTINVNSGTTTFNTAPTGPNGTVTFNAAAMTRQSGAVINFTSPTVNGLNSLGFVGANDDSINFTTAPATVGNSAHFHIGIIPYALVNGADFATYQQPGSIADPTVSGLATFNDYASSIGGALPGDTVREIGLEQLSQSTAINGLVLATSTAAVAQSGFTLTLTSGGLINTNSLGGTVSGGPLVSGTGELILANGLVAGGLLANFYAAPNLSHNNTNNFGGNVLGAFGQVNFNQPPAAQRVDPEIDYLLNANTNGNGLFGAGGVGQPAAAIPPSPLFSPANLAVQWSGNLNVVQGGTYVFFLGFIDDYAKLYIDGQLASFNIYQGLGQGTGLFTNVNAETGTGGGGTLQYGSDGNIFDFSVNLTPGLHTVLCDYLNSGGGASLALFYKGPDSGNAVVIVPGAASLTGPGFVSNGLLTVADSISGSTSVTLSGGQINLLNANTFTGTTYLAGAILQVGSNTALGTSTLNLNSGQLEGDVGVVLNNPFTLNNSTVNFVGSNNITLAGLGTVSGANSLIDNNTGQVNITGTVSGAGSLNFLQSGNAVINIQQGIGSFSISGANTYSGGTTLTNGSLVIAGSSTTSGGVTTKGPVGTGTLTLNGGTLYADANAETLTNNVVVNGNIAFGGSAFNGTSSSASSLTFAGPGATTLAANVTINITGATTFSGAMGGPGLLTVIGQAALTLSGNNSYAGGTLVNAGVLGGLGTLILGSNNALGSGPVTLENGIVQAGIANLTLANQLTISEVPVIGAGIGAGNQQVATNAIGYVAFTGGSANNTITFANTLTSNALVGQANLIVNTPTTINEILTGSPDTVTGINLDVYSGTSTLTLTQANSYIGYTVVNGGTLVLSGASGSLTGSTNITLNAGGTLTVDDTHGSLNNRLDEASFAALTFNGGTLNINGPAGSAASESFNTVSTFAGGSSTIVMTAGSGGSTLLNLSIITRLAGATVLFKAGTGQTLGTSTDQIAGSGITLANGIIPYATVSDATTFNSGYNLATVGANGIQALPQSGYTKTLSGNPGTDSAINWLVTASTSVPAGDAVNSMFLAGSNITVSGSAGTTFTVGNAQQGAVVNNGTGNVISIPTLAFAAAEALVFTTSASGSLAINSTITGSGGLTITGPGTLILPSANAYTGGANSQQTITVAGTPATATAAFTLNFDGAITANIAANATAASVQTALQNLTTIGPGNVLVTSTTTGIWTVAFTGGLAGAVQPQLAVVANALVSSAGVPVPIQITVVNTGLSATNLNSGTVTLGTNNALLEGVTVTNATIQATTSVTLAAPVSLGAGSVQGGIVASSGSLTIGQGGLVAFTGGVILNGPADVINTANTSSPTIIGGVVSDGVFTGLGSTVSGTTALIKQGSGTLNLTRANTFTGTTWIQAGIVNVQTDTALGVTGDAQQVLSFQGQITAGTFTLSFEGATSSPIPWAVQNSNNILGGTTFFGGGGNNNNMVTYIQGALDELPTIGAGNCIVTILQTGTGATTSLITTPLVFLITFTGQLAATNLPTVVPDVGGLSGTGISVQGYTVTVGNSAANVVVGNAGAPATLQLQGGDSGLGGASFGFNNFPAGLPTSIANHITVSGSGVGSLGAINDLIGNDFIIGPISLYGPATIGSSWPLDLQGEISGSADLTKIGSGTLILNGLNTYTGATNINAGILNTYCWATVLGLNIGSVVVANGASLEFGMGAAIAGKQLTLNGSGFGEQVEGGQITGAGALWLHDVTQGFTWTGNVILASNTTINSSFLPFFKETATAVANGESVIYSSTSYPLILSGIVSGTGGLTKVGAGTLSLWSQETYLGATVIQQGNLALVQSGILPTTTTVNVAVGGTLLMDNSTQLVPNRYTGSLTLSGGTLSVLGNNVAGATTTETLGTITLAAGASTIASTTGNGGSDTTVLTSAGITRLAGATVSYSSPGSSLVWGAGNQLLFTGSNTPTLVNGIIPYATVTVAGVVNFGTYTAGVGIAPYANYVTTLAAATPTSNLLLTAGATLSGNLTVNALLVTSAATLSINLAAGGTNNTLTIGAGVLINNAPTTIAGGTLNFGSSEGILFGTASLSVTGAIAGASGLTVSNSATVTLGTAGGVGNTYAGATTQNTGTLIVNTISSLSSGPVNFTSGTFGTGVTGVVFSIGNPINFTNAQETLAPNNLINLVGQITLTGANNLNVSPGAQGAIVSGIVTGTGSLNLISGNSLVLTNALNNYSGGTILGGDQGSAGTPANAAGLQIEASDTFQNAIQTLTFAAGGPAGGTFTLAYNGLTTASIIYSTIASTLQTNIQSALTALAIVGAGAVAVSAAAGGTSATVTFQGDLAGAAQPLITVSSATITIATTQAGQVLSGPVGTGPLTLFGNGPHNGSTVSANGGGTGFSNGNIVVVNNTAGPLNSLAIATVTLHNPVIMNNSAFNMGGPFNGGNSLQNVGGTYNAGGNLILAGPVAIAGNCVVEVGTGVQLTLSGQIAGDGNIDMFGLGDYTGSLALGGDNASWSGGVNLNANNVVVVGNNNALGSGLFDANTGVLSDDGKGGPGGYVINTPIQLDGPSQIAVTTTASPMTITSPIFGASSTSLTKMGPGNLILTNTDAAAGATNINQGTLTLAGGGAIQVSSSIVVNPLAILTLDNSTLLNTNRIGDLLPITLAGGTLNFIGNPAPNTITSETLGVITLNAGQSVISSTTAAGAGDVSILNIATIARNAGSLLNFSGIGANIGSQANQINVVNLTTATSPAIGAAPVSVNQGYFLSYASVTGITPGQVDFASVAGAVGPFTIAPFSGYDTNPSSTWGSNDLVEVTANDQVGSPNTQCAALLISGDGITLGGGGGGINLTFGAILSSSGAAIPNLGNTLSAPLTFETEALLASYTSAGLNVSGVITSTATTAGLTLGGSGVLTLSGANTLAATSTLGSGTLVINSTTAFGAAGNALNIDGGTLQAGSSGGSAGITIGNNIALNMGPGETANNSLTFLNLSAPVFFSGSNQLTLTGVISGTGGITVNSGTLILSGAGANTYVGNTTVNPAGTLVFGKTISVVASAGLNIIYGGTLKQVTSNNQFAQGTGQGTTFFQNGGTLSIGNTQAIVRGIAFTNGGTISIGPTGSFIMISGNIAVQSTNGLPSTATITGGTYGLSTSNARVFSINPSGGLVSTPVEAVTFAGAPTGGNFTLTFNGSTTNNIAFSATATALASAMQSALTALPTIGAGNAIVTAASAAGATQTVTFNGGPTGGSFILTFNGQPTSAISYSTSASTLSSNIATALNALLDIGPGGVSVSTAGSVATVTFVTSSLASSPQPLLAASSSLSGGSSTSIGVATSSTGVFAVQFPNFTLGQLLPAIGANGVDINAQQQLTFPGAPTGGTFQLVYGAATTAPIAYSAVPATLAGNIQNAFNLLSTLGAANAVDTMTISGTPTGGTFSISFNGVTSSPITYSTTASVLQANIQNALGALTSISTVTPIGGGAAVAVNTVNALVGTPATAGGVVSVAVTFQNALGGQPEAATLFSANTSNLTGATIAFATTTSGGPAASSQVNVSAANPTTVNVTFQGNLAGGVVPLTIAGNGFSSNALQQIAFPAAVSSGTFVLTFNGKTTTPITYSSTASVLASSITSALNALANIGGVNGSVSVTVSGSPQVANVTFLGSLAATAQPPLSMSPVTGNAVQTLTFTGNPTGNNFTLGFGAATTAPISYSTTPAILQSNVQTALSQIVSATSDVWTLNFTGTPAGTFTIAVNGVSSGNITYSSTAATLQANILNALNALSSVYAPGGAGTNTANVVVSSSSTSPTLTFQNALGGQAVTLTITSTGLTSGALSAVHTTTGAASSGVVSVSASSAAIVNVTFQGVQGNLNLATMTANTAAPNAQAQVSFAGVTSGTFTLKFNGTSTVPIAYSATASSLASNISNALSALTGSGNVAVTASGSPLVATVTFQGALAGQPETLTLGNTTPNSAVQQVSFPGNPTGGVFTLTFVGTTGSNATTGNITFSTNSATLASNIQTALNTTFGSGNASVAAAGGNTVSITFLGQLAGGVEQIAGSGNGTPVSAVNAQHTITFSGSPTGGSFKLVAFNAAGQPTAPQAVAYSANPVTLQASIQAALDTALGAGNTLVSANNATSVSVTYQNALGGLQISTLQATGVTQLAVQSLTITGTPTGGNFSLTYASQTTAAIAYSTNPRILQANIQNALNSLSSVGITGGVPNTSVIVAGGATSATITFQNALGGQPVSLLVFNNGSLQGTGSPVGSIVSSFSGFALTGGTTPSVAVASTVTGSAAGFAGLTGTTNFNIVVTAPTAGFGLTGNSPAPAVAATTTGGQGGLAGGVTPALTVATTTFGYGLNGNLVPTFSIVNVGGTGGLTGGASQVITDTPTVTGFGLVGGSNPSMSALVSNAGFGGDMVISAQIVPGNTAGANLVKTGLGTLTFAASTANNYPGQTTVDQGTLLFDMQAANAYAYNGTALVVNGFAGADAVRVVSPFSQINPTTPVIVNGAPAVLDLTGINGNLTTGQTVGALAINGGTVKLGNNTLTLTGTLTAQPSAGQSAAITNTTSAGQLVLPSTATIIAADSGATPGLIVSAVISGTGGINKQGTGTLVLANRTSNSYSGVTTVNEGTLQLAATGAVNAIQTITFGGTVTGGLFTLAFNGATTGYIAYIATASATLQGNIQAALNALPTIGAGNTSVSVNSAATSATVTFQNQLAAVSVPTMSATNGLQGTSPTIAVASTTSGSSVTAVPTATGQLVSVVIGDFAGGPKADVVQLRGSNEIAAGAGVAINNSGLLDLGGNFQTINGQISGNAVSLVGGAVATEAGALTVGGAIASQNNIANTTPATISGNLGLALTASKSTETIDVLAGTAGSLPNNIDLVVSATITGPANVGLIKSDTGAVQLTGANSYTGPTAINGGTLEVDGSVVSTPTVGNAIQSITFTSSAATSGTFTLVFNGVGGTPISYSSVLATLQSNIQSSLTGLVGVGNAQVSALSSTLVSVTFQNLLGGSAQSLLTVANNTLNTGSISIATIVPGFSNQSTLTVGNGGTLSGIGTTGPVTVTAGGTINPGAPAPSTGILSGVASIGQPVTTDLSAGGNLTLQLTGIVPPISIASTSLTNNVATINTTAAHGFVAGQIVAVNDSTNPAYNGSFTIVSVPTPTSFTYALANANIGSSPDTGIITDYDQLSLAPAGTLGILRLGGTSTLTLDVGALSQLSNPDGTVQNVIQYNAVEGQFSSVIVINNPNNLTPVLKYNAGHLDIQFAGPAQTFQITGASTVTAGVSFPITVRALDAFGQTAVSYTGTVHFKSSDTNSSIVLPANVTLINGVGNFNTTLITATQNGLTPSVQTITTSDTVSSSIIGNIAVTVSPAAATHFAVGAPGTVTTGTPFVFSVTAQDAFNNIATAYPGVVRFTSSDTQGALPLSSTLTSGTGSFAASFHSAGNQTIVATDANTSNITGTSTTINVISGAVSRFTIIGPAAPTLNTMFQITVAAKDASGNTVTGYNGTVHFTSSDSAASLPLDSTLANGQSTFNVTLKAAGSATVTATDTASGAINGAATFNVTANAANHFSVTVPASATAGHGFVFTVTAKDLFNNTSTAYNGTIHFSSSDGQVDLPTDATLTSGVGFFSASLRTAGNQTITATDTVSNAIAAISAPISVTGLAANHLAISAATKEITGVPFPVTVQAQDQFGNIFLGYTGVVHFTSTDLAVALPGNASLSSGVGTFNVTLKTPGTQTINANDISNTSIAGASNNISTLGLVVASLTPTSTGFVAVFNKAFDPSQINLYDNSGANGPDDVLLTGSGSSQTSFHGSLIVDPSNQTITFIKTSTFTNSVNSFNPQTGVLTAGTYTVTFRSAANGFVDSLGAPLDGTASGNPAGSNYTTTFVVTSTPTEVVGVPGFARGPNSAQTINLPNNLAFGMPLNLSTGSGVTAGKFTLQYNSALLSITGVTVNSALTGATLTYDAASTAGSAVIDFSSPTALAAGPIRLGGLVATVPNSAAPQYTNKALLHWSSVSINGGVTAAVGDDAVDVLAYFGDANGDGTLSGGDASQISQVATGVNNNPATGTIGGFSAFRLADPVLIGDLTASGNVGAGAVTLMNSFLSGTPRAQIPALPSGLTIPPNGVDPALSIPADLQAASGGTVVVPVQIDSGRPQGSTGVMEAILAVRYDPAEFTVSAQDVQLGALPLSGGGWQLQTALNVQTGELGIDLFSSTPMQTSAGGPLVTISFHVRENAAAGSTRIDLVPSVNPTGFRPFLTTIADTQGAMVLHTADTPLGTMPGSPGDVSVGSGQWAVGSEQRAVNSEQLAASNEQWATSNKNDSASAPSTVHLSQSAALLIDQVFGERAPLMIVQEGSLGQPAAILNSGLEGQANNGADDQALLQVGVAQHDWVPADMVAYLGRTAKFSLRSPIGDLLDGGVAEQDGGDLDGLERFFAAAAGVRNGSNY